MTRRATANILVTLPAPIARRRLLSLTVRADVLALQEMPRGRDDDLARLGALRRWPLPNRKQSRLPTERGWTFHRARAGGGPIGVRDSLGERVLSCKAKVLTGPGYVGRSPGRKSKAILGPSFATRLKSRRADGTIVVRYNIHLTAGVQDGKNGYRHDKASARRVARHKKERRKLERLVARDLKRGYDVEVYGDTNLHQMPIPGLVGWWALNDDAGTLGDRAIDGIWTTRKPESVRFLPSIVAGEHRHVVTSGP